MAGRHGTGTGFWAMTTKAPVTVRVAADTFSITNNQAISMEELRLKYILGSVVYSFIGIFILLIVFVIIEKLTPENLWKEILEKRNMALAIMAAALMIAVAIIISSAIHE
jgi:F0F1-type ATP synthase membrane subunit c/vacuolar-type H+-ATPase subunit K